MALSAARIRSRASPTALSGKPTSSSAGWPTEICTCTSTGTASMPEKAKVRTLAILAAWIDAADTMAPRLPDDDECEGNVQHLSPNPRPSPIHAHALRSGTVRAVPVLPASRWGGAAAPYLVRTAIERGGVPRLSARHIAA